MKRRSFLQLLGIAVPVLTSTLVLAGNKSFKNILLDRSGNPPIPTNNLNEQFIKDYEIAVKNVFEKNKHSIKLSGEGKIGKFSDFIKS